MSRNSVVPIELPTLEEARELMDPGRIPYSYVRTTLLSLTGIARNLGVTKSVRTLYEAQTQEDGIIDPPLTPQLEDAIIRLDSHLTPEGDARSDFNYHLAEVVLEAVFEHGYMA